MSPPGRGRDGGDLAGRCDDGMCPGGRRRDFPEDLLAAYPLTQFTRERTRRRKCGQEDRTFRSSAGDVGEGDRAGASRAPSSSAMSMWRSRSRTWSCLSARTRSSGEERWSLSSVDELLRACVMWRMNLGPFCRDGDVGSRPDVEPGASTPCDRRRNLRRGGPDLLFEGIDECSGRLAQSGAAGGEIFGERPGLRPDPHRLAGELAVGGVECGLKDRDSRPDLRQCLFQHLTPRVGHQIFRARIHISLFGRGYRGRSIGHYWIYGTSASPGGTHDTFCMERLSDRRGCGADGVRMRGQRPHGGRSGGDSQGPHHRVDEGTSCFGCPNH